MKSSRLFVLVFILLISLACQLSAAAQPSAEASPTLAMRAVTDYSSPVVEPSRSVICEVTAREFLNVRGGPSVSWSVLRQLERGDTVRVTDWADGWAMVRAAEWVNGDYLKCQ